MYTTTVDFKLISLGLKRRLSADEQLYLEMFVDSLILCDENQCIIHLWGLK